MNEMTMNLEQTALSTPTKITEENKKYLLLKHHEVVSSSKYDLGKCTTSMNDIELKSEDVINIKQFRIPEAQHDVQKHIEEL